MQYLLTIDSILDEGKKEKCIRQEVNNRIFRNLFLGAFCHITLRWQFADWKHANKLQEINQVVDLITRAVAVSENDGKPNWAVEPERR
jgi:TetR/AcrR family fatty acid metabolism transcriptional regulator